MSLLLGSIPAIQLAHAGRKAARTVPGQPRLPLPNWTEWNILGPSPIAFPDNLEMIPREATLEDLAQVRNSFVQAAKRAIAAGFEIIELHFAHGYLVSSFLSPYANHRTDQYGGSFENRTRLAVEIVRDVKATVPEDYPIFVRISASDNAPNGWSLEDSVQLARRLKELGVSLVDCSSGGNADARSSYESNVDQVHFAEVIQREAGIATGAVGGIVNPRWAEQILRQEKATLVLIGRASLDDPNWPLHAAFELGAQCQFQVASQYNWSIGDQTRAQWRQRVLNQRNREQLE